MRLLLTNIATGQLRHCVSRCHFLADHDSSTCGGSDTLRAPPHQPKSWRGSAPASPPGSRASVQTHDIQTCIHHADKRTYRQTGTQTDRQSKEGWCHHTYVCNGDSCMYLHTYCVCVCDSARLNRRACHPVRAYLPAEGRLGQSFL